LLLLAFGRIYSWRIATLPIVVLVATLPLTQSRTAALASLTAVGIATWLFLSARRRVLAVSAGFVALAAILFAAAAGVDFTDRLDRLARSISRSGQTEELKNFTGRAQIWEYAWSRCVNSPLFGYGYGASRFALQQDPNYPLNFPADHAHNLYLNTALTMGFPGAALLAAMMAHMFVRSLRWPAKVVCVVLAVVMVASITEVLLYGPMPRSHTFIWLTALFWQQTGMEFDLDGADSIRGVPS
jgi:O-antigen ligase